MYDIWEKKFVLSLEFGIFNDDFGNYVICIGEKEFNGCIIYDVFMYDYLNVNMGCLMQVVVKFGEMFIIFDGDYFVM